MRVYLSFEDFRTAVWTRTMIEAEVVDRSDHGKQVRDGAAVLSFHCWRQVRWLCLLDEAAKGCML